VPHAKRHPVAWRDVSNQVAPVVIYDLTQRLFRTPGQFHELFGSETRAPVDFSKRQLLLVSPGPRSSTGYAVRILSVTARGEEITVEVRERTPTLADRVEARVTHPFRLLSLPSGKDVLVDWEGR
jgi:protease stability complex PrcB-like protein